MAVQPGMQELQDKKGANKGALLMLESTLISWSLNLSATLTLRLMPQVTVIFFSIFFYYYSYYLFLIWLVLVWVFCQWKYGEKLILYSDIEVEPWVSCP